MPKFFFNLRFHDHYIPDTVGDDLPDITAARIEATEAAREMLIETIRQKDSPDHRSFEITNEKDELLATVHFRDMLNID
jgi:hypothetical protein